MTSRQNSEKSEEIIDLKKVLEDFMDKYYVIVTIVTGALLDPNKEVRQTAIQSLENNLNCTVKHLYLNQDNEIILNTLENSKQFSYYISKAPTKYLGKPIQVHEF